MYDGGNAVLEMNSSGTVTAVNCFGPDGLVSRQSGGNWTYYTFDQQGNVAVRQNSDGSISSRSTFDAYGAETATNSPSDPYAYNGQWGYYYDRETGLYYCQNRYYDPSQGRWLNRDPIGYSGGANLYGYCGQNSIKGTDPRGRSLTAFAGAFLRDPIGLESLPRPPAPRTVHTPPSGPNVLTYILGLGKFCNVVSLILLPTSGSETGGAIQPQHFEKGPFRNTITLEGAEDDGFQILKQHVDSYFSSLIAEGMDCHEAHAAAHKMVGSFRQEMGLDNYQLNRLYRLIDEIRALCIREGWDK